MDPREIEIIKEDPRSATAAELLRRYYEEIDERFPVDIDLGTNHPTAPEEFEPPTGAFLVARLRELPVGCGAIRQIDETIGEIKRMWLDPSVRGQGVGRQMLAALEDTAGELGYESLCLDTSNYLSEAISLYRSSGYEEVAAYNDNPHADLWFLKSLN